MFLSSYALWTQPRCRAHHRRSHAWTAASCSSCINSGHVLSLFNLKNTVEIQRGLWEGLLCLFQSEVLWGTIQFYLILFLRVVLAERRTQLMRKKMEILLQTSCPIPGSVQGWLGQGWSNLVWCKRCNGMTFNVSPSKNHDSDLHQEKIGHYNISVSSSCLWFQPLLVVVENCLGHSEWRQIHHLLGSCFSSFSWYSHFFSFDLTYALGFCTEKHLHCIKNVLFWELHQASHPRASISHWSWPGIICR